MAVPAAWIESLRNDPEVGGSLTRLLGVLVSGPPIAPHRLVRRVRRALLGPGTLHLEAELCDSEIVEAVSKDGLELEPEFRAIARGLLRERVLSAAIPAAELRSANRCDDLGMSPLLHLEEQLIWTYVSEEDPRPECDRLLTNCLITVVREDRKRILDWASGALRRLPDLVVATPAAWLLSEVCTALQRTTRQLQPPPVGDLRPELMSEVLQIVPSVLVGLSRDGDSLQLGFIDRKRRVAFAVPGIALRPVTVTWTESGAPAEETGVDEAGSDGGGWQQREVTVDLMERTATIPVGTSEVRLRNATGATVVLRAFERGSKPPELVELDQQLDTVESAWVAGRSVDAVVLRPGTSGGAIVRFVDAPMLTAHLRFDDRESLDLRGLRPAALTGQTLEVRISNFDRPLQRIVCRPAPTPVLSWSVGILAPGMRLVGRVQSIVNFGTFVAVPTTEQVFDGPVVDGLIHRSRYPWLWTVHGPPIETGEALEVEILEINRETRRIQLGLPSEPPASPAVIANLPIGTVVLGTVVRMVYFGAFVRLPSGVDGLLHRTEIAADLVLDVDTQILVRVIRTSAVEGRVWLATEPPLAAGAPTWHPSSLKDIRRDLRNQWLADAVTRLGPRPDVRGMTAAQLADRVAKDLRGVLSDVERPVSMSLVDTLLRQRFGSAVTDGWLGFEKLKVMLAHLLPEATIDIIAGGHVHPLRR
ncbi:S1 RNA-binding domain-containing protein [Kribbella endophytica]